MAADLASAVWKACNEALSAAQAEPVYNGRAIQGASMPYTVIDSVQAVPDEQIADKREIATVYFSCWAVGPAKPLEMLATIHGTLHQARLTLDTGRMVRAYVMSRSTSPDIEEQTFVGQARVRVIATR